MGIEVQTLKMLVLARQAGVDFAKLLTIGRQDMLVDERDVRRVFGRFGEQLTAADARAVAGTDQRFNDAVFHKLGAATVDFMDISDFEGATVIQDLNAPLEKGQHERFSAVFDGGTLEHVFNPVRAMETYMALPRIGGHLIIAVPANNEMGHGFYQFSPEFFFRTLAPANGFRVAAMFMAPMFQDTDWWLVRDPAVVGKRVGLNTRRGPLYLFVIAEKTGPFKGIVATPLQSDYAAEWQKGEKTTAGHQANAAVRAKRTLLHALPDGLTRALLSVRDAQTRPDPAALRPFSPGHSPFPPK